MSEAILNWERTFNKKC